MAIQTLQDGLRVTGNDVLMTMLEDVKVGKNLHDGKDHKWQENERYLR